MKNNIFVEGVQGSGKTTLLRRLAQKYPEYTAYYEGDLSPAELAWCSYQSKEEYEEILSRYDYAAEQIRRFTMQEGNHFITAYTRVLAEKREFYEEMEAKEIYNGRVPFDRFHDIIMSRYQALPTGKYLFECSFFQNSIESMMLFYETPEEKIVEFYREAYEILKPKGFLMYYLEAENIRENILKISAERVDDKGNELWYPLMMQYFTTSPYGKRHNSSSFDDLIGHFERRAELEKRIIREVLGEDCVILPAKNYEHIFN